MEKMMGSEFQCFMSSSIIWLQIRIPCVYVSKFQKKSEEVNSKRSRWWVLSLNFLWPRVITEHWTLNHWGNTGGTLEWYYCGGSECITSVLVTVLNLFKIHFLVGLNNFLAEGLIWGNWIETAVQGSAIRCLGDKGYCRRSWSINGFGSYIAFLILFTKENESDLYCETMVIVGRAGRSLFIEHSLCTEHWTVLTITHVQSCTLEKSIIMHTTLYCTALQKLLKNRKCLCSKFCAELIQLNKCHSMFTTKSQDNETWLSVTKLFRKNPHYVC